MPCCVIKIVDSCAKVIGYGLSRSDAEMLADYHNMQNKLYLKKYEVGFYPEVKMLAEALGNKPRKCHYIACPDKPNAIKQALDEYLSSSK